MTEVSNVTGRYWGTLELTTNDFIFNKTANTLTLSTEGLNKVKTKNEITTNYYYNITFKFTTSSEAVSNKETTYDVFVQVENAKAITKSDFESMMKTITSIGIYDNNTKIHSISSFASLTLGNSSPHYSPTVSISDSSSHTFKAGSSMATTISSRIERASREYFKKTDSSTIVVYGLNAKYQISGKEATFTFPIGCYQGYVFADDIRNILSRGLSIKLTLPSNGSWSS